MDTNTAILTLQTESENLQVVIDKNTQLKAAIDLAVTQLQGTLTTQLTELDAANAEITNLQEQAALSAPIDTPPIVATPSDATSTPV